MSVYSIKSAAMLLNEICSKAQTRPMYDYAETVDAGVITLFTVKCTVSGYNGRDFESEGSAKKKKLAMQEAAKIMIEQKLGVSMDAESAAVLLKPEEKVSDELKSFDNISIDDVPPQLAERRVISKELTCFCEKHGLTEPEYTDGICVGPPHNRLFSMICKVGVIEMEGVQKTKKQCKQIAAWKMLQKLENLEFNKILVPTINDESLDEEDGVEKTNDDEKLQRECSNYKVWHLEERVVQMGYVQVKRRHTERQNLVTTQRAIEKVKRTFLSKTAGPALNELLEAGDELIPRDEFTLNIEKNFREWLSKRVAGGAQSLFDALQDEMQFTVKRMVQTRDDVEISTASERMTWRDKRDQRIIGELRQSEGNRMENFEKLQDKYDFTPNFAKYTIRPSYVPPRTNYKFNVTMALELKLNDGERICQQDREPTASYCADTEAEATEACVIKLLEYIVIMCKK